MYHFKLLLVVLAFSISLQTGFTDDYLQLSHQLTNQIHSGDVLYQSVYTHQGRPQIEITSLQELVEYSNNTPLQEITYTSTIHAVFKGGKLQFDIDKPPCVFYPNPTVQTFLYDGKTLTMYSHVNVYRSVLYTLPYREGHIGALYLPPVALGYDTQSIIQLAAKVKNQNGELPSLNYVTVGNETRIVGTYSSSNTSLTLAQIEWNAEHPGVFNRCIYKQPNFADHVEIIPVDYTDYNGVLYPKTTTVRQIVMQSLDDSSDSKVISEQVLTVLEAGFNLDSIDEKLYAGEEFLDYPSLSELRQKAREQAAQKAAE